MNAYRAEDGCLMSHHVIGVHTPAHDRAPAAPVVRERRPLGWLFRQKPGSAAEDVLAAHRAEWVCDENEHELIGCSCGYATHGPDRQADLEAHQASALAAAGCLR